MIILPAGNASEWTGPTGNNTYLLTGRVPALVDAGVGREEHIDAISRALEGNSLALLLITHGHVDHMAGVPALIARWPSVRVRQLLSGEDPIRPHERIPAGNEELIAIPTPGHSPDHCCFFSEETGDVFSGDLARAGGTIVIPASRGGDLEQYLASLRRIRDLRPSRLLPGHGPVLKDPDEVIDGYLRHRAARDAQILQALDARYSTPAAIVAHVYGRLSDTLTQAAMETVLAHLVRLERLGRVARTGDRWVQAG